MPAHLPIILGLGLSVGVATAIYINKDKIKDFVEHKKRELELELQSINNEIQRTFNPDTSYELNDRNVHDTTNPPSTASSSVNPFSDSYRIPSSNVSASDDEDDLYHSVSSNQLRNRTRVPFESSKGYESDGSSNGEFFSYVEVKDDENVDDGAESSTEGVYTPTASEAGDYIQAKQFA